MESLPGPTKTTELHLGKQAKTEAYIISDLSLLMGRISKTDFANLNGIRGWIILELVKYSPYTTSIDLAEAKNLLSKNYIIKEKVTNNLLAVFFTRQSRALGIAWLPNSIFSKHVWVNNFT